MGFIESIYFMVMKCLNDMKIIINFIFLLLISSTCAQRKGYDELVSRFPSDTIYVYLPLFENQENRHKNTIRVSNKNNYFDRVVNSFYVKDTTLHGGLTGFLKSKYMNFSMKVPDMKLIDKEWINNNPDKIIYPEIFEKYQMLELYNFLSGKLKYLIEEENFFGEKVYAREVKLYPTYSMEE